MKTLVYLAWFASALALALGQPSNSSSSAGNLAPTDVAAIRAASKLYEQSANLRDWGTMMSIFTDDIVFMPPNATLASGRKAVEAMLNVYPTFRDLKLTIAELEGHGNLAFVRGQFSYVMTPPGQPEQPDGGKYIEIWRKRPDGKWKYARGIFNSDNPVAGTTQPSARGPASDALLSGTWELNLAKSRFNPGPAPRSEIRTYSTTPDGRQHATYDLIEADGKRVRSASTFTLDGKDSPITGDLTEDTQAITRTGPRTISAVIKKNGRVTRTAVREVSADGKTLTLHFKGENAKGQPVDDVWVFDRKPPAPDTLFTLRFTTVKPDKLAEFERLQRDELIPALKKAGVRARYATTTAMFGEGYVYAFGTPLEKFAELDDGEPLVKALGENGAAALLEKLRACQVTTRLLALRTFGDLSWENADPMPMFVLTRFELAPGRKPEWLQYLREHHVPAVRSIGVKQYFVQETVFGGNPEELYALSWIDRYADIDGGSLRRKLGEEAYGQLMARRPAGAVVRTERSLVRTRPDLSIIPEAKQKPTE